MNMLRAFRVQVFISLARSEYAMMVIRMAIVIAMCLIGYLNLQFFWQGCTRLYNPNRLSFHSLKWI